ncbi:cobalamin B12-binding domain-containing protein [Roseovarius faecimaris]|uniref:cobalamin B12-binding domain-containing protein n=1 Tax=Roseovarius faecimaris TaxID=2494550 RepID=UPI001FEB4023|nr:hypothetical protein [Roseovarius faecimaris]
MTDVEKNSTQDPSSPKRSGAGQTDAKRPAIRFLVESALRTVAKTRAERQPRSKAEWVARLGEALMSESEVEHQTVVASLIASGASSNDIYQYYIPEASRFLGEKWVRDEASFVDVTVGSARLQALFRDRTEGDAYAHLLDRSIPLGQSVLMVIPEFEQHSLGAFVAADGLRRHGVWVRMAIGLNNEELCRLVFSNRFSMLGVTLATWKSVEHSAELIGYLRSHAENLPPIVAGGRVVEDRNLVAQRSGVDFAVKSVHEAVERCGLATVAENLSHIDETI